MEQNKPSETVDALTGLASRPGFTFIGGREQEGRHSISWSTLQQRSQRASVLHLKLNVLFNALSAWG